MGIRTFTYIVIRTILLIIFAQFTGCVLPKHLSQYDVVYENRMMNGGVHSQTKNFGFNHHDKITGYTLYNNTTITFNANQAVPVVDQLRIYNDTLVLSFKSTTRPGMFSDVKIPISEIRSVKVMRFYTEPAIALASIGLLMLINLLVQ